ncbi:hypothetical protein ACFQMB_17225 [Pseudobowmanella zhangzhouensis]
MLLPVLIVALLWQFLPTENRQTFTSVKALTSDKGTASFPQLSPSGDRLLYTIHHEGKVRQFLKRVSDQQLIEISHGEDLGVGPAKWRDDGRQIVYLAASPSRCEYYVRDLDGMQLSEPQLIHQCPAGSYGIISYTHKPAELVFTATNGDGAPYLLYRLNLNSQQVERLNQPQAVLAGNSQFDLHPVENKLLISSPDQQQWEGFYQLDLNSNILTLLFKQNAYVCCGIWSQDGEHVVVTGEHPTYQLSEFSLDGDKTNTLFSGPLILSWPQRHSNGRDYLFTGGQNYYNSQLYSLNDAISAAVFTSSTDDRLAHFAPQSERIAFVSQRSGNEEIWLADSAAATPRKLTHFSDSRHYIDLVWSPDDRQLAGLTLNQIHLIDTGNGATQVLDLPEAEIRGLSFKDAHTLAFSLKTQTNWQLYFYDLQEKALQKAPHTWQFARFSSHPDDSLWLDQQGNLYVGAQPQLVADPVLRTAHFTDGRQLNLIKQGKHWYWQSGYPDYQFYHYNQDNDDVSTLFNATTNGFDVRGGYLLFSKLVQQNANIYSTESAR